MSAREVELEVGKRGVVSCKAPEKQTEVTPDTFGFSQGSSFLSVPARYATLKVKRGARPT